MSNVKMLDGMANKLNTSKVQLKTLKKVVPKTQKRQLSKITEAVLSLEPTSAKDVVESHKAVESAIDAASSGGSGFEAF